MAKQWNTCLKSLHMCRSKYSEARAALDDFIDAGNVVSANGALELLKRVLGVKPAYSCAYPDEHELCKFLYNGYCVNPGNCPTGDKEEMDEPAPDVVGVTICKVCGSKNLHPYQETFKCYDCGQWQHKDPNTVVNIESIREEAQQDKCFRCGSTSFISKCVMGLPREFCAKCGYPKINWGF